MNRRLVADVDGKSWIYRMNVSRQAHLKEEELDLYADGKGSELLKARVKAHITSCVLCKIEVETIEEYRFGICGEELETARAKVARGNSKPDVSKTTLSDVPGVFSKWFAPVTPGFFAVPVFAATVGDWSKEEMIFDDKAGYIWRELGDGRLEQRFTLRTDEAHQIQWEGDNWVKEVVLEKGPFGWSGTLILTVEERIKLAESAKVNLNVI